MGCAFDMYSQSWNDRSYGSILFLLFWFFPLSIIFSSYAGIIYHTRNSYDNLLKRTKTFRENGEPSKERVYNDNEKNVERKATWRTKVQRTKVIFRQYYSRVPAWCPNILYDYDIIF